LQNLFLRCLRIAKLIFEVFENKGTVLNIGAGAGSYEPEDRYVISVEPSKEMREQRLEAGKNPAVNAKSDNLPFDDNSFNYSTAFLTIHHWIDLRKGLIHHWIDLRKGLEEMKRVSKDKIIIMTYDPAKLELFWNVEYFRELIEVERARYPSIEIIKEILNLKCEEKPIPIPFDCEDGFQEAFYGRPEKFLDKEVRMSQSAWGFLSEEKEMELVERLRIELDNGEWDRKYGHYRDEKFFNGALRLLVFRK